VRTFVFVPGRSVRKGGRSRKPGDPTDLVSPFAEPEIGFAWIIGVAATDRYAYVNDAVNKRVLRVKLGYATEASCGVR